MVDIRFPSASETTEIIDAIRGTIGRVADFYVVSEINECPVCTLDPVSGTSTDSFCPTCSGTYYILTYSGVTISGHVWWKFADQLQWPTGGQLFDGDASFQLKYNVENMQTVNNTKYLILDGKTMTIRKKVVRGVPELNRIILTLYEEERNGT